MISTCIELCAHHYTMCMVIMGTTIMGATCGLLGTFGLLKGYSLFGDALSHAALPGVAVAVLLNQRKDSAWLMVGGALTGALALGIVYIAQQYTRLKLDSLLGTLLSVFFGIGLIVMTVIQKLSVSHQAALNTFVLGNAATLMPRDMYCIIVVSLLIIACLCALWKEFVLATFDTVFARAIGYRVLLFEGLLACLLIMLIAVGLQTVGVILMTALLIAPAAAARQWTARIKPMALTAACIGGSSCMLGAFISSAIEQVPTGPIIVVIVTSIAFISLCVTPYRVRAL
ncbi:metal ABC transporter permease [Candidatus Dependentiae bacterium]|nr:metal ABC transporter permease [Candidatus Dependentiae bacterium]MCC7414692.1 metal ABC transporter permease [Campylobacterota bacterium]